jgi:sterol 3beta-glucosyltransferase
MKMHATIVTIGSRGDVQPYIALGAGLQAAGYSVRLATHTDFEPMIRSRGLDFSSIGSNIREMMSSETAHSVLDTGNNPLLYLHRLIRAAQAMAPQAFTECLNACQDADALLLSMPGFYIGYHIAEKLGRPFYLAYLQPITPTGAFAHRLFPALPGWFPLRGFYNQLSYIVSEQAIWQLARPLCNKARRDILNLPPMSMRKPFQRLRERRIPILYGYSSAILPRPPDWGDHVCVTGNWFLDSPPDWQPPPDLVDFLESGSPPIYVGFGSMSNRRPAELTKLIIRALALSGQRGILLTGWGGLSKADLPNDTIFQVDAIPHDWLFRRMAALVHHGGAGTTAAGLRAGKPSIIVPFGPPDQTFWGRRVLELGVGPAPIPRKQLTVERLAEAINLAASDAAMGSRAEALGKHLQSEDGVANAVEAFQMMTEGEFGAKTTSF